jgi:hypothetical protein
LIGLLYERHAGRMSGKEKTPAKLVHRSFSIIIAA